MAGLTVEPVEETFYFYGTPLGDEDDRSARPNKTATDLALVRNKPVHEQVPTDDQGRKVGSSL